MHHKYNEEKNRLRFLSKNDDFIKRLPNQIRQSIVVHYLFDDVFFTFRQFFRPQQSKDTKFLYDMAFGLKPRHFGNSDFDEDWLIYEEEEIVCDMFFI